MYPKLSGQCTNAEPIHRINLKFCEPRMPSPKYKAVASDAEHGVSASPGQLVDAPSAADGSGSSANPQLKVRMRASSGNHVHRAPRPLLHGFAHAHFHKQRQTVVGQLFLSMAHHRRQTAFMLCVRVRGGAAVNAPLGLVPQAPSGCTPSIFLPYPSHCRSLHKLSNLPRPPPRPLSTARPRCRHLLLPHPPLLGPAEAQAWQHQATPHRRQGLCTAPGEVQSEDAQPPLPPPPPPPPPPQPVLLQQAAATACEATAAAPNAAAAPPTPHPLHPAVSHAFPRPISSPHCCVCMPSRLNPARPARPAALSACVWITGDTHRPIGARRAA